MSFDELLIRHSSPTLAGIKPASLINLRFLEGGTDSIDSLKEKGLSFMLLTGQSGYPLLLVYRLSAINEILKSPVAKSLLGEKRIQVIGTRESSGTPETTFFKRKLSS